MKKQSTTQFTAISAEHTKELTTVVKETLATGLIQNRIFSAADLWDIQRRGRGRTMMSRRSYFA
ncbi:MAG TPA: hypothetical protein PKJ94_04175 [Ferruginibacter sp.]|nr:hypothetical protein [Ferruginibacter sp.]